MTRVTVDNNVLTALANKPDAVKEFPELARLTARPKSGCASCKHAKQENEFIVVKMLLAGLSGDRAQKLKIFLNADTLFFTYKKNGNFIEKVI